MDGPLDSCLVSFCKMETHALISFAPAAQVWVFALRAFKLLAGGDDWLPMIGVVHVWRRWGLLGQLWCPFFAGLGCIQLRRCIVFCCACTLLCIPFCRMWAGPRLLMRSGHQRPCKRNKDQESMSKNWFSAQVCETKLYLLYHGV